MVKHAKRSSDAAEPKASVVGRAMASAPLIHAFRGAEALPIDIEELRTASRKQWDRLDKLVEEATGIRDSLTDPLDDIVSLYNQVLTDARNNKNSDANDFVFTEVAEAECRQKALFTYLPEVLELVNMMREEAILIHTSVIRASSKVNEMRKSPIVVRSDADVSDSEK